MTRYFLSSFQPININKRGLTAIEAFGLKPYIDGSCRREPDFESKYPSISALCHASKFAPRLKEEDVIVFITVKKSYYPYNFSHWRLVAILKVIKRFETHDEAKEWYLSKNLPIPSNCMVEGNKPLPLEMTTWPKPYSKYKKIKDFDRIINIWDKHYKERVQKHGTFLICEAKFLELSNPPVLTDEKMKKIFGKIPVTRNPPKISEDQFEKISEITKNKNL